VVGLFVESAQAFGVYHEDVFVVLGVYRLVPDPESLGTGVDSGTDAEALALVENDAIEQIALTSSIQASDCDDAERRIQAVKELFCFWGEFVN
jgi:hypothetical protein